MRLPYAAKQLLREVAAHDGHQAYGALSVPSQPPDGLGVWRTISFEPRTSKWLTPALEACADARILRLDVTKGRLSVTFVPDTRADQAKPFHIETAHRVLTEKD